MENNEIMTNEAVVDAAEELVETNSMNGLMYAGAGVAIIGAGYLFATKVAIPAFKKIKAKVEEKRAKCEDEGEEDLAKSEDK